MDLKKMIRDIPDFPKKGIVFKDITTLLADHDAFKTAAEVMAKKYFLLRIDKIIAIEARGFILGGVMAYILGCGFIPVRKPGKLPALKIKQDYALEYGTDTLEIHQDAVMEGENVIIVDDLLATGGTAGAVIKMVEQLKGNIMGIEFLVELTFLGGRERLSGYPVHATITF